MPKGGAAVAEHRRGGGGESMVRAFLITVRIRRAGGPPRVRAFVVRITRPSGEWAEPGVRAAAALVLKLVRSRRRPQQPHPRRAGHDDGQHPRGRAAAVPRRGAQLRRPYHPHPTCARRGPGRFPGHARGAAPSRRAAGRARCLGPPARGPG
ncbi:tumor suppressor ARF isoform X2 [Leptonychotes weddellii]|uniref:Tumor suppressor ARF isoform X2 n=1 Tax=Leptonychotes weddellii TaxID=9713 RepID=A0A7F8RWS1_LEPWE|nr:tumor suppressor ARF isoform X2 [Leptonychotes weddellii]